MGDASPLLTRVYCRAAERLAPARVLERGKERHIMAAEDEVRQASERFYAALNRVLEESDTEPMGEIWSHSSDVSAMHPFGGRMVGWEAVGDSWEQAAKAFSGGQVAVDDMVVVPISEDAAFTLGTELGQASIGDQTLRIEWRATNAYRRESDGWKMVHHHTDFSPEVSQALSI
jgi:ketosteroid isomerase-like protein